MRDRRTEFCERTGCYDYYRLCSRGLENTPWGRRFHRWKWCLEHMAQNKPGWPVLEANWIWNEDEVDWPGYMLKFLNSSSPYRMLGFQRPYYEHPLLYDNEWTESED